MSEVQWIKLAVSIFDSNRKVKQIETMKNGDTILIIWFKLLCLAGRINDGGVIYITPDVPYTTEGLADELRRPIPVVKTALDTFESYGMIIRDDMGFIRLSSWGKHQNIEGLEKIREQTRARVAKCRANKNNATVTPCNATSNATVTPCNATEEEREEEQEGEDSFTHSYVRENISKNELSTQFSTELSTREETKRKLLGGELGGGVVFLSDEQYDDLFEKLSFEEFQYYIGVVRDQELQGKHYKRKTHYKAILDMAMKDRKIK